MGIYERVNGYLGTNYASDTEISWQYISANKVLTEDFIREFKDKVNINDTKVEFIYDGYIW